MAITKAATTKAATAEDAERRASLLITAPVDLLHARVELLPAAGTTIRALTWSPAPAPGGRAGSLIWSGRLRRHQPLDLALGVTTRGRGGSLRAVLINSVTGRVVMDGTIPLPARSTITKAR